MQYTPPGDIVAGTYFPKINAVAPKNRFTTVDAAVSYVGACHYELCGSTVKTYGVVYHPSRDMVYRHDDSSISSTWRI